MKIHIFSENHISTLEDKINCFLEENKISLIDIVISVSTMKDYYLDGTVCNTWSEYIAAITYTELMKGGNE